MTKRHLLYDSNVFIVAYSPNVFIYWAELNKQAPVVNLDGSPTQAALTEKPCLESPIAEQVKLFSVFLRGRSVEKGGGAA